MSENSTEGTEPTGDTTNVDADQVVVNQAPDGGGVDNQAAPEGDSEDDSSEE